VPVKGPNALAVQPALVVWIVVAVTAEAAEAKSGALLKGNASALMEFALTVIELKPTGLVVTLWAVAKAGRHIVRTKRRGTSRRMWGAFRGELDGMEYIDREQENLLIFMKNSLFL
jgi:hypothetical protein